MAPQKSISELAALIHEGTKTLEAGTQGQPGSDFSLAFTMPPVAAHLDASLETVRSELIEAADELKARLLGPFPYMGSLALPVVRNPPIPSSDLVCPPTLTYTYP